MFVHTCNRISKFIVPSLHHIRLKWIVQYAKLYNSAIDIVPYLQLFCCHQVDIYLCISWIYLSTIMNGQYTSKTRSATFFTDYRSISWFHCLSMTTVPTQPSMFGVFHNPLVLDDFTQASLGLCMTFIVSILYNIIIIFLSLTSKLQFLSFSYPRKYYSNFVLNVTVDYGWLFEDYVSANAELENFGPRHTNKSSIH